MTIDLFVTQATRSVSVFLIGAVLAIGPLIAHAAASAVFSPKPDASDAILGFDQLHQLHLTMSAKEWEAMQPAASRGFGRFPGQGSAPDRSTNSTASGQRQTYRGNMFEFPIAHGDLMEDGQTYRNIAVRYKGNFTYMASAWALKRSLKVDLAPAGQAPAAFHGLHKFNLHAGVTDPTRQREALSYAIFRAAGVPASRTAFVELTLTVPGKYDREYLGLFVLVEDVDSQFLGKWVGDEKGLLLKPQGVRGPEYLGDNWQDYDRPYGPNRPPSPAEAQRVIAFAKLVSMADDAQFHRQINDFLEVDEFLRFLAVNAILVNLDSPLAMPQNFYLYLHPQTQRFIFIAWDLDLSLAAWPFGGSPEQQMDLSLLHPHVGEHKLIDRLLAIPTIREQYLAILRELTQRVFVKDRLFEALGKIEATTKAALAKEAKAVAARHESGGGFGFGPGGIIAGAPSPRTFIEKRLESIQAQLSGRRPGYSPRSSIGATGGRNRPRNPDEPPAR